MAAMSDNPLSKESMAATIAVGMQLAALTGRPLLIGGRPVYISKDVAESLFPELPDSIGAGDDGQHATAVESRDRP